MPTAPNPGAPVVPVTQALFLEVEGEHRTPIAMQLNGTSMVYLVAQLGGPPAWYDQSEVTTSYIR
jgi:hypothetical protein